MDIKSNLLGYYDFHSQLTTTPQAKGLFGATVAARLVKARDEKEFKERIFRDVPAWLTIFYLGSILERTVGFAVDKFNKTLSASGATTFIKGPSEKKTFLKMLNPFGADKPRSFKDIEALESHISKANYEALKSAKTIVFGIGLLVTSLALGVLGTYWSAQQTRKACLKEGNGTGEGLSNDKTVQDVRKSGNAFVG